MDGQPRDAAKDKGADELSSAPVIAKLLTVGDVGPGVGLPPPDPVIPPIDFEAENLAHTESGGSYTVSFEDTPSGGAFASPHVTNPSDPLYPVRHRFVTLGGDGVPPPPDGEYVEFTLPGVPRGTYNLVLRYKSHPTNREVARLSLDGPRSTATSTSFRPRRFARRTSASCASPPPAITRPPRRGREDQRYDHALEPHRRRDHAGSGQQEAGDHDAAGRPHPGGDGARGGGCDLRRQRDGRQGRCVPVVFTPPSGSVFPLAPPSSSPHTSDFAGNMATATFKVVVRDTTAPAIQGVAASPASSGRQTIKWCGSRSPRTWGTPLA